jgi:hypothetical protein
LCITIRLLLDRCRLYKISSYTRVLEKKEYLEKGTFTKETRYMNLDKKETLEKWNFNID